MRVFVEKRKGAGALLTKASITGHPVSVVIYDDHIELEFYDNESKEHSIYICGYYNPYYQEGLPDDLWDEYVLGRVVDATPAARSLLTRLREQIIMLVERGDIPRPKETERVAELPVTIG